MASTAGRRAHSDVAAAERMEEEANFGCDSSLDEPDCPRSEQSKGESVAVERERRPPTSSQPTSCLHRTAHSPRSLVKHVLVSLINHSSLPYSRLEPTPRARVWSWSAESTRLCLRGQTDDSKRLAGDAV